MKIRLICVSLLAVAASSAFAADLRSVESPPPIYSPPKPNWGGFYAGLNAGYDWGTADNAPTVATPLLDAIAVTANTLDPAHVVAGGLVNGGTALANTGLASLNQDGFVGGGQVGYNYQWSSNFLAGLEADIQGAGVHGSGSYAGIFQDSIQWNDGPGTHPCGPSVNCVLVRTAAGSGHISANTEWIGTVRARLGYLFTPAVLVYGTGGLAYGGVNASAVHSAVVQGSIANLNPPFSGFNGATTLAAVSGAGRLSSTRVGWTAGGGVEWMFAGNWSLQGEALYYQLGNASLNASPVIAAAPFSIAVPPFVVVNAGQVLIANKPVTRVSYDGVMVRAGVSYHF